MIPRISVVLPTFNGATTLRRQLVALTKQRTDVAYEVLVVDNNSTDNTKHLVDCFSIDHPNFRLVPANEDQGVNYARNVGVQHAKSQYLVFCDSDDEVSELWLQGFYDLFKAGFHIIGGPLLRKSDNKDAVTTELNWSLGWLPFPSGANCGLTKEIFNELDGFDQQYRGGGDETEFFWRAQLAGYALQLAPDAFVGYSERRDIAGLIKQSYFYGKSHVRLFKQFRALGMPRSQFLMSTRAVIKATLLGLIFLGRRSTRRKSSQIIALHFGRLVASFQMKVFYL